MLFLETLLQTKELEPEQLPPGTEMPLPWGLRCCCLFSVGVESLSCDRVAEGVSAAQLCLAACSRRSSAAVDVPGAAPGSVPAEPGCPGRSLRGGGPSAPRRCLWGAGTWAHPALTLLLLQLCLQNRRSQSPVPPAWPTGTACPCKTPSGIGVTFPGKGVAGSSVSVRVSRGALAAPHSP